MTVNRLVKIVFSLLIFFLSASIASADNSSVFKGKTKDSYELTDAEENTVETEFKVKFEDPDESGAFQKKSNNPWAAKKERGQGAENDAPESKKTWGDCREFSYKKRGQCYAKANNAYACERNYEARIKYCDDEY